VTDHSAKQHDRLNVERRVASATSGDGSGSTTLGEIKTSDIARLMELFQVRNRLFSVPHCVLIFYRVPCFGTGTSSRLSLLSGRGQGQIKVHQNKLTPLRRESRQNLAGSRKRTTHRLLLCANSLIMIRPKSLNRMEGLSTHPLRKCLFSLLTKLTNCKRYFV
jgi:hypothetical protein